MRELNYVPPTDVESAQQVVNRLDTFGPRWAKASICLSLVTLFSEEAIDTNGVVEVAQTGTELALLGLSAVFISGSISNLRARMNIAERFNLDRG